MKILNCCAILLVAGLFSACTNSGVQDAQNQTSTDAQTAPSQSQESVVLLNDDNFDKLVLNPNSVFLVDFYADWCPPCRMQGPIIDELAGDYKGRAFVGKINVDNSPNKAGEYSIRGIPALILFKNGRIEKRLSGLQSIDNLKKLLDNALM